MLALAAAAAGARTSAHTTTAPMTADRRIKDVFAPRATIPRHPRPGREWIAT
jgi:hypothetical protein